VSLLHFLLLLFEHFGIIQENVRVDGGKYGGTKEKVKFFSVYVLLT